MERFGLVDREVCACQDVIIVPVHASEDTIVETLLRHRETRAHRSYVARDGSVPLPYYQHPETPLPAPVSSLRLTIGHAATSPEDRLLVPDSGGGVSIRPDGYDFEITG